MAIADGRHLTGITLMPTDPTRSTPKRKRVERNFHAKWDAILGAVRRELNSTSYYHPQNDRSIGQQTSAFREWLETELDTTVVEPAYSRRQIERGDHYTGRIVREFHEHGIELAHAHLKEAGASHRVLEVPPDAVLRDDNPQFGGEGIHHEYLTENYDEIYSDVVDVARETSKQAYREYRDAAREGATLSDTLSRIIDRIEKVGITRTDLVARTKLIQVINDAVLARYDQLGVTEVGVEIEAPTSDEEESVATDGGVVSQQAAAIHSHPHGPEIESQHQTVGDEVGEGDHVRYIFETAGDERVCQYCAFYEGTVYTLAEIRGGAVESPPLHPNCRCVFRVYDISDIGWT